MNKQIPLDPFQGNISSGTGTVICDLAKYLGTVVEKIQLNLSGTSFTRAHITGLRLRVNGKIIFESTGTRLDASNQYLVTNADATILKMDFMDRKAVTPNARQIGTLDLSVESGIKNARLEVDVAGATAPVLSGIVDVSKPTDNKDEALIRWMIARRHSTQIVIGASGYTLLTIPHLNPMEGGSLFRRINIYSANCTGFKLVREGIVEFEVSKAQNIVNQLDNNRAPQSNLVVFDPCQDGQTTDRMWDTRRSSGINSAMLYGQFSAGETITVETEELLPWTAF